MALHQIRKETMKEEDMESRKRGHNCSVKRKPWGRRGEPCLPGMQQASRQAGFREESSGHEG